MDCNYGDGVGILAQQVPNPTQLLSGDHEDGGGGDDGDGDDGGGGGDETKSYRRNREEKAGKKVSLFDAQYYFF